MLVARSENCCVAKAFWTRLKLIWPKSSLKTTKMSKKTIFWQKAPGVNGLKFFFFVSEDKSPKKKHNHNSVRISYLYFLNVGGMMLSGASNGSFQYDYGAPLGGPSGRRSSAIKYWVLSGSKLSVPSHFSEMDNYLAMRIWKLIFFFKHEKEEIKIRKRSCYIPPT